MINLTGVVKNLIIINVIVYFVVSAILPRSLEVYFVLYSPATGNFLPVQLVTHMFMHAGIGHLFFNMLVLYFLGPMVERTLGEKRFLTLYFVSGLVAAGAQLLFAPASAAVGASGAIIGVTLAFATMFPNVVLQLIIPPIPIKAKYFALIIVIIDLFGGLGGSSDGIAHFAHLGGAVAGFIMIHFWKQANLR